VQVCPNCGHENLEDTDFCANCGEYLRWDQTEVKPPPEPSSQPTPEPEPTTEPGPWPGEHPAQQPEPEPQPQPQPEPSQPAEPVLVTLRVPGSDDTAPPTVAVEPGGEVQLSALVRNQSEIVDTYELAVEGLPASWWSVEPPRVHLLPYGSQETGYEQEATLRLRPPRASEASAGEWPVGVAARSVSRPDAEGRGRATLDIAPFLDLGSVLRPEQAEGERGARYQVVVRNGGNRAVTAFLSAEDPELVLGFEFQPARLDVPAGGTQASELNVTTRRQPSSSPRQHRFVVTTSADGATAQATGSFVQTPAETPILHRRGGQLGLRLLLTLLAAALLIGGSFATWTDEGKGFCRHRTGEGCLDYQEVVQKVASKDVGSPPNDALFVVGSAGFVTIVLGVMALLGLRKGRSTWLAGILALAFVIVIAVRVHGVHAGLALPCLGSILAIVAGFLPTVFRDA
jgi:zinc-ribbon domain